MYIVCQGRIWNFGTEVNCVSESLVTGNPLAKLFSKAKARCRFFSSKSRFCQFSPKKWTDAKLRNWVKKYFITQMSAGCAGKTVRSLENACHRAYLIAPSRCLRQSTIATSIVHSKLDYCNSLYYNLPQSQIKKLQNIQNSLARAVTRTPKSSHITPVLLYTGWKKTNALNINSFLWLIRFSQPTNRSISTTLFLFNLVTVHVLHLWSLLLAYLPAPLWKSPIAPLGMLHRVYGMNSPLISASLVRHSLLLFLLSHMAVHHILHYHRLHHLLLAQSFILNSRLGSSANPFLHRPFPFLPDWLHGLSDHAQWLYGKVC